MKKNIIFNLFLLLDIVIISFSFYLAWFLRFFYQNEIYTIYYFNQSFLSSYNSIFYISNIIWILISTILDLQHVPRRKHTSQFWKYFVYPQFLLIFSLLLGIVFINLDDIPRLFLIYFFIIQFCLLWISRKIRKVIVTKLRGLGFNYVQLSTIGNQITIKETSEWLEKNPESGFYNNINFESIFEKCKNNKKFALEIVDKTNEGDYILLSPNFLNQKDIIEIIDKSENKGIHVFQIIKNDSLDILERNGKTLGPYYVLKTRYEPLKKGINKLNKRIIDFFISSFVIIFIYWWLYIILGIIIKFNSKGPIIFKQERVGLNGEIFWCLKFRTMYVDSSNSKQITKTNDPRIIPFGKTMRKLNLDEFPQFINVIKGEMSIIGPRPHMLNEDRKLCNIINKYRLRYWVRPGITGLAAISGLRGGTENKDEMQNRINIDIKYIENWSFMLDLKIIFKTALEMILVKSKGH